MSQVDADAISATVRAFIQRTRGASPDDLTNETPLFGGGYLDSFALAELMAELEQVIPQPLPDGALLPEDFESIATLVTRIEQLVV